MNSTIPEKEQWWVDFEDMMLDRKKKSTGSEKVEGMCEGKPAPWLNDRSRRKIGWLLSSYCFIQIM